MTKNSRSSRSFTGSHTILHFTPISIQIRLKKCLKMNLTVLIRTATRMMKSKKRLMDKIRQSTASLLSQITSIPSHPKTKLKKTLICTIRTRREKLLSK
jgi:hypothetical protein